MRKNTARHWLHAALDLLPVILIPVFMIYSHRHTLTERTEVDIQYKYQSNEVNSIDDLIEGNIYEFNGLTFDEDTWVENTYFHIISCSSMDTPFGNLDEIFISGYENSNFNEIDIIIQSYPSYWISISNNNGYVSFADDIQETGGFYIESCIGYTDHIETFKLFINSNIAYYDMVIGDIQYTDYNVIESVDVQDSNSSIMNVFMDDFNYSVNKYFNMGNVFNLKDVYHWFEVNIFNNNPPVVMASIYNIIVYEFVMDLLFLLYGLFMWFVDMLKRLIEKPIDSIK